MRIVNHLGLQLGFPAVLFLDLTIREATELEYQQRILKHLGFQRFDSGVQRDIENWLEARAAHGMLPAELVRLAEDGL